MRSKTIIEIIVGMFIAAGVIAIFLFPPGEDQE